MGQVHLLFANKSYDTSKQVLTENQIVIGYGYGMSEERYVVYKVENKGDCFIYHLINVKTRAFTQTDLPQPLSEKFGIGMYYNDKNPEFMDAFEVLLLQSEAEYKAKTEQEEHPKKQERNEQLKAIGEERNIYVQSQATENAISTAITGDFLIVDYSPKALAIFGDTRPIKEQLKTLGGSFNPRLTHEGEKKAGWIFSKSKEQKLRNLLTIK